MVWTLGVAALLVALPMSARDRLPDQVATHWSGSRPDGSMPLTTAALFPAVIWLLVAAVLAVALRFRPGRARGLAGPVLAATGVLLSGAQASIVRSNLDRVRWQDAAPMDVEVVLIVVAAGLAGALAWLATRRPADTSAFTGTAGAPATRIGAPVLVPGAGERLVWLSQASNHWLQALSSVLGLLSVPGVMLAASGRTGSVDWRAVTFFGLGAVVALLCSSVRVRVTEAGLHIGFGPFGWPARRLAPAELVSARVEQLTAREAGGWGYRVHRGGSVVFLRRGACLVVRTRRGRDFAVSVDDAERGAALLNALIARTAGAAEY
ncbi:DUF1648 domain-containing protein [Kitasatospora aureofaciens]|uniref:DUF1648 domain-containing protein n=1 Tax=Kitasatospora aureofaciens TaxID=1894 RepID=UPI00068FED23|nr:DUF1648 domain-containing protein [Kitasatospora aureofaciens]HJD85356.1 DUF1648 domain-containing protein [Kitasatospora aureofaciens]